MSIRLVILAAAIVFFSVQSACPQKHLGQVTQQDEATEVDTRPVVWINHLFSVTHPNELDFATDFEDVHTTWLNVIRSSRFKLDLAFFYASDRGEAGDQDPDQPTALSDVVEAIRDAGVRGVEVRFLVDSAFENTYPALIDRLDKFEGVETRVLNLKGITGGVMHAKYMISDSWTVHLGSANFDWRSLEHVLELGMTLGLAYALTPYSDVFELDWHLAGGGDLSTAPEPRATVPYALAKPPPVMHMSSSSTITPVFSPKGLLPNDELWDLPHIIERITNAKERVWIQVMTFKMKSRDGEVFHELQDAILGAAKRGVDVRLLVADWGKRPGTIEGLQELSATDGISVRMATIPEHSSGHIPYARVIHAKYMVVDQDKAWVGSSNWEKGYFYESRNVGVLIDGAKPIASLAGLYELLWDGPFAYDVDPDVTYEVPNFGDRD